ncbi:MAG: thioredoxin family protein [Paracoccaceae bacterium]|nr:MAG: thioredoxin family protein [Paracoccaceae bacterium]
MTHLASLILACALLALPAHAQTRELLMFERPGCSWCERWHAEIAPAYPNTDEGRAAPLQRLQVSEPLPDGVTLDRPAILTPTFVLIEDGREVGRIEGYPGDQFFWFLLGEVLARPAP